MMCFLFEFWNIRLQFSVIFYYLQFSEEVSNNVKSYELQMYYIVMNYKTQPYFKKDFNYFLPYAIGIKGFGTDVVYIAILCLAPKLLRPLYIHVYNNNF